MKKRSAIREVLTDKEINDCLQRAFQALPAKDKENVQAVVDKLTELPLMGPTGALGLIFAVDQAPALERLNQALQGG